MSAQLNDHSAAGAPSQRIFLCWEVVLVLGLSLGIRAIQSILGLAERVSLGPISDQTVAIHTPRSQLEFFDLSYQLVNTAAALFPVALVIYLVFLHGSNPFRAWGLDFRRPGRDWLLGVGLLVVIGLGTLVVYGLGRAAGITAELVPAQLGGHWWDPVLLLISALRHSLVEEVILMGYLFDRALRIAPRLNRWVIVCVIAALRGSYHLYQGFGPGIGNFLMGIIFGWLYLRYGRIMPLVIAHFLLDAVAFLAFPLVLGLAGIGS